MTASKGAHMSTPMVDLRLKKVRGAAARAAAGLAPTWLVTVIELT